MFVPRSFALSLAALLAAPLAARADQRQSADAPAANAAQGDAAAAADPQAALQQAHRGKGPSTLQSEMTMTLIDAGGASVERTLQIRRVGDAKQLIWFEQPANLRGTGFLRVAEGGEQKIWLYLPSFKKLERIGAANENRSFLGSDFTYADMGDRNLDRYAHRELGRDTLDGKDVQTYESVLKPGFDDAPYGKIVSYVGVDSGRLLQEDLYDRKGDLIKRRNLGGYQTIGGYTIPTVVEMTDLGRDHRTRITLKNVKVDESIDDNIFTTRYLQRLR